MTTKKKDCEWCKPIIIIITLIIVCVIFLKVFVGIYYVDKEVIKNYDTNQIFNPCIYLDVPVENCICTNYTYSNEYNNMVCSWIDEVECSCKQVKQDMRFKFK